MTKPIVVIGGDAAGMSAASKIKRESPETDVIVFERSPHISYAACGIPYWIGGVVASDEKLLALTIEDARSKRGIDVRIRHEVTRIEPTARIVYVQNLESGTTLEQPYEKLILTTGASANKPKLPGADLPSVFTLRTLNDAQRLYDFLDMAMVKRAVIVGAGYIALEMAEAFHARGIAVDLLVRSRIMSDFDAEMMEPIATHLSEKGITIHWQSQVQEIVFTMLNPEQIFVRTEQSKVIGTDLVLFATGVQPNSSLAKEAGLQLGANDAIWVDDYLYTSDPHILAAGDCVAFNHIVTNQPVWIPLAPSANKSGRIAGGNAIGERTRFPGIAGTAVIKVFDYTISMTGLTEEAARRSELFGRDGAFVGTVRIKQDDKAGYMPGAEPISTKLVFDTRDGRLLGGQLVGTVGVNKRIDILATALAARMTLWEISMLDLSYAPPYSTVYDPILVAANVGLKQVMG